MARWITCKYLMNGVCLQKIIHLAIINTICVCGAGTMGSGIAQVAAMAGYTTIQFDVNEAMLEKSKTAIQTNLQKLVEKGKITPAARQEIMGRLLFTPNIQACRADLVIEAIIEDKAAKINLFTSLAAVNSIETIFASNTSSISVTEIAEQVENPARIAGMHFFNPAPLMKLVEVVKTNYTANQAISTVITVARQMGKTPVVCTDSPGFIVNRVARHYYLEAMKLVELGLADITTVDTIMEAAGFKMGPFRLMDLIGLDVNYSVSNIVWNALGQPERLTPSPLQKQKVDAGELGAKSGKGWTTPSPKGGL